MFPPIFEPCAASTPLKALIGSNPIRFYDFGDADQNTTKPYVVWQTVSGNPENYLKGVPDTDRFVVQVDAYALTRNAARAVAEATRDALEPVAYVTGYGGEGRDPTTRNYRCGLTVEFLTKR